MSHCSRLDQFEIRTLLMCYLYIVKMISEGWWLLLLMGCTRGQPERQVAIVGCLVYKVPFLLKEKDLDVFLSLPQIRF